MNAEELVEQEDFKRCAQFHGHICPGLAIGYRAAKAGLQWIQENRSMDEEIVAIVETDACGADAVQVLSGCTFGKGNLIYRDYGKNVFSFVSRNSGRGVRVALRAGAMEPDPRQQALMKRMRSEKATAQEREEFWKLHRERAARVLEGPIQELFSVREVTIPLPPKAVIEKSRTCNQCGEPTMPSKMKQVNGQYLCQDCADNLGL